MELDQHIGRSEEFMRAAEKKFEEFSKTLQEIKAEISILPELKEDVASMKPEVERWTTTRKGFYFFMFILGVLGTAIFDPIKRLFNA